MKKFLEEHRALLFGCVILAAIVLIAVFPRAQTSAPPQGYAEARVYWAGVIRSEGAQSAYRDFVSAERPHTADTAHIAAHAFGRALFDALGDAGLVDCGPSFGYGCYHGFFTGAIGTEAEARIKNLYDVCISAYGVLGTGCQHGIGHGILEYVGYDNLEKALSLCDAGAPQPSPLLGCSDGVFMDYFWPLGSEQTRGPSARAFDAARPYDPCPQVSAKFAPSCYFELGTRYVDLTTPDYASLCAALLPSSRLYCFLGVGAESATPPHTFDSARASCAALPDAKDALYCRAGIAWTMFSIGEPARVRMACADPDPQRESQCLSVADFTQGADLSFPKP